MNKLHPVVLSGNSGSRLWPVSQRANAKQLLLLTNNTMLQETVLLVQGNESVYIPLGSAHRLRNLGRIELERIEVQSGSYLGEGEIVRLEDDHGDERWLGGQA